MTEINEERINDLKTFVENSSAAKVALRELFDILYERYHNVSYDPLPEFDEDELLLYAAITSERKDTYYEVCKTINYFLGNELTIN